MIKMICAKDVFSKNTSGFLDIEGCGALVCGIDNTKPIRDALGLHECVNADGFHYGQFVDNTFKVFSKTSLKRPSHRMYYAFLHETEKALESFTEMAKESVASFCTGTHRGTVCVLVEKLKGHDEDLELAY